VLFSEAGVYQLQQKISDKFKQTFALKLPLNSRIHHVANSGVWHFWRFFTRLNQLNPKSVY